jgi:hypothetical protein
MVTKLGATSIWRIFGVAGALQSVAKFLELRKEEVQLRRILLLGTSVNKGKRKEGRLAIMGISYIYMGYYNTRP